MKKAFLIFFIAMISSIVSFGQLQEVKGVETKLTTYCSDWFGYSFYNMNSIPVSVESELHEVCGKNGDNVIDVKTFILQPKEEYVWKFENRFRDDNLKFPFAAYYNEEPYAVRGNTGCRYYVKYKAYKIL